MKTHALVLPLAFLCLVSVACDGTALDNTSEAETSLTGHARFSAGSLVVISFIEISDFRESEYTTDYLPSLRSLAAQYGGQTLVSLNATNTELGELRAHLIRIDEWSDGAALRAFRDDPRHERLEAIAARVIFNAKEAHVTPLADAEVHFKATRLYEVFGATVVPEQAHLLPLFFHTVIPISLDFGRTPLVDFAPAPDSVGSITPGFMGLVEFPGPVSFHRFVELQLFREAAQKYRDPALDDGFIINTSTRSR